MPEYKQKLASVFNSKKIKNKFDFIINSINILQINTIVFVAEI